jgi:P4 family phage/plasmid primase-like protien
MPRKNLGPKILNGPVTRDELKEALDFAPKTDEDRSLFAVLAYLRNSGHNLDAELAELPATMYDHAVRFAKRTQGYVTYNRDEKLWTIFNGKFHQEAPNWVLLQCVAIVSEGLDRESDLLLKVSKTERDTLCQELGIDGEALKELKPADVPEFFRKVLVEKLAGKQITIEQFNALSDLVKRMLYNKGAADALKNEALRIRDGERPIQLIKLAANAYGIEHGAEDYDRDGLLFVVQNGTLDLRYLDTPDRLLRPSKPSDLNTMIANVTYDPQATAPLVQEQLEWVFCQPELSDEERVEALKYARMLFGGTLDRTRLKGTFLILSGIAGSGKSILLNTLGELLGTYTAHVDGTFFLDNPNRGKGDATPHLAKVVGKALVLATEIKNAASSQVDEQLIKNWTGDDTLSYRPLYGKERSFKPTGQLVMSTNELPRLSGDKAVGDRHRLAVLHISRAVPPEKRKDEGTLKRDLLAQGSGFLNILLQGLRERNQIDGRIPAPAFIQETTSEYIASQDEVEQFFVACGIQANPQATELGVSTSSLYKRYIEYKGAATSDLLTQKMFAMKLQGRGFKRVKQRATQKWHWRGIFLPEQGKITQDMILADMSPVSVQGNGNGNGNANGNGNTNGNGNGNGNGHHNVVILSALDAELNSLDI